MTARLFPRLTGGVRWGLDRTRRLLAGVGDPHLQYRVIHVGGTNGKGSAAAHLDSVLRADGVRVGLYSSPHLCTFRERIRIDGLAISEQQVQAAASRLWAAILDEDASFFEATTAIAFLAMAEAGVETAVVEVGLGGRLDSTNVVDPDVVVLTNVSLDHVQLLGPTLAHVAIEKAGIIKTGVPVVTGEINEDMLAIFAGAAAAAGAPLRVVGHEDVLNVAVSMQGTSFRLTGTGWGNLKLSTPLIGEHQAMNAALAVHALDCMPSSRPSRDALHHGLSAVRWPGRLQVEQVAGVTWVFDVAHNAAGVTALCHALDRLDLPRPMVAVVGVLGDKDWTSMLQPILARAADVILTVPPTAPVERRWDPHAVLETTRPSAARVIEDLTDALESAHGVAAGWHGCVLVTGSFHTVGDSLAALGLCADGSDSRVRPAVTLPEGADPS